MAGSDKRKQSLYFPEDMLKEIQEEATRQDRSPSDRPEGMENCPQRDSQVSPVNEIEGGEDDERGSKNSDDPKRDTSSRGRGKRRSGFAISRDGAAIF